MFFVWFIENEMITNADNWHLLLGSIEDHTIESNKFTIKNSRFEKPLEVHFDDELKFNFHIEKL